jgi:hypothetical protein
MGGMILTGENSSTQSKNIPLCPPQIPQWTVAATNHLRLDTAQTSCSSLHYIRYTRNWYYLELRQAELLLVDIGKLQVWQAGTVPLEVLVSTE